MSFPRLGVLLVVGAAAAGCSREPEPPATPTFNRDVAPIVFAKCASCHRPDGVAPFSLLTYRDAVKRADAIVEQTRARHMPPWLPERGEFPLVGDRRLRDDEISTIQRWADAGAPEGAPGDLPAPPAFAGGWELGQPDHVLAPAKPYVLQPTTDDVYRNLVLRTALPSTVFVRAVEFKTGGAPIHHAVIRVDRTSTSRRRDGEDGQPGFDGMAWNIRDPEGQFIGWAPGRGPIVSPDGMPWRLERGADLVVELHLVGAEAATTLRPEVALFLASTPPARTPLTVRMGSKVIDIPAGARDYVVTDTYELPVDVELLSVYPHAHYLAKDMRVTARAPGGTEKSLLHIPHWSFHWQQDYRFVTPVPLRRGTTLTMRYTYDNSAHNEMNPRNPPVRVLSGPLSTDEMAELGLQFLPASPADAMQILQAFDRRERLGNIALGELRVRVAPDNAEYQAFLGGSYVEAERYADGARHLEIAIARGDRTAATHNYYAVALKALGRAGEALTHFRRAAALAPRDEVMSFNLGTALAEQGRAAEAAAAFERSLAINPEYPDAHVNLGTLLLARRRMAEAIPHFERAVALRPDSAAMHNNLGGALASAGRLVEGMQHVRRALALDPAYAPALDNLQRLQRLGIK